jgi:Immunity protein Imm1
MNTGPAARLAWLVFRDAEQPGRVGPNLLVGLSGDLGVLMWQGPLPPGDRAVVSAAGSNRHRVDYFVAGIHHADFPVGAEIPVERVLAAVTEFLDTGERPTCVQWQAD